MPKDDMVTMKWEDLANLLMEKRDGKWWCRACKRVVKEVWTHAEDCPLYGEEKR